MAEIKYRQIKKFQLTRLREARRMYIITGTSQIMFQLTRLREARRRQVDGELPKKSFN